MKKYVKNPVELRALQYDGTNLEEIKAFAGDAVSSTTEYRGYSNNDGSSGVTDIGITTFGETRGLFTGDWVIEGVKGEFYPCKDVVFMESYYKSPETYWERLVLERDQLKDKCDRIANFADGDLLQGIGTNDTRLSVVDDKPL